MSGAHTGTAEDASVPSTLLASALQREYAVLAAQERRLTALQRDIARRRREIAALEALVANRDGR
jgi:hypothetical protein